MKNLKTCNGVLQAKRYFEQQTIDKILLYHKIDQAMHVKIDRNLIPKKERSSYFEAMAASGNVGKGPYKLTRYKVWEEPPKLVVVEPSEESFDRKDEAPGGNA